MKNKVIRELAEILWRYAMHLPYTPFTARIAIGIIKMWEIRVINQREARGTFAHAARLELKWGKS